MEGKILHTSWGYSMTLNDYAVVIEETPKSVLCKMIGIKVSEDTGMGSGKAMPVLTEKEEKPLRLFKRGTAESPYFKGSYPYCNGSKRMGYFNVWNGRENYHNTCD